MGQIDKTHSLSVSRQCELLNVARSSFYYSPLEDGSYNEELMKQIDKQYMDTPFYGVPRMTNHLRGLGYEVNPKRIRRLYRKMDLYAIGPRPNTSKPHKGEGHAIYPYRLRGLEVTHSNHVWCIDITYIPMAKGFLYLTAIIDVYSRYIVGWDIHNTLDAENSLNVLRKAILVHGKPEIVNSDQGSQFTCPGWIAYLESQEITISMDGKGRALDNVWIERFWRTLKQEYVYICPAGNGNILRKGLIKFITYYNNRRQHQSLDRKTPFSRYEYAA